MPRKDKNSYGSWRQLGLFEKNDTHRTKDTPQDNIICLKTKMSDTACKHEKESRNKCINRLIDYAKKLDW